MGKRSRQRGRTDTPTAPTTDYPGPDGMVLAMRGALSPATRRRYADALGSGLDREDARARGIELLFEHLTASWTIAGVTADRQKELLGRYRMASASERDFVLATLRAHLTENFPEMEAP